ncbi:hypothetical protein CL618_01930 [archaeon]|nr:hypothetical protein [archaeon]
MQFHNDYWNSMDRKAADNMNVSPSYVGISAPPMEDQVQALKGKIWTGVSNVELGFMGQKKGSMGQKSTTPGMYGKEEREAIRHMAKINEINLTTHASPNVQGFAGLTQEGFKEEAAEDSVIEVKRAIDFAADTAGGGAVVVHAGEFPTNFGGYEKFEKYPDEDKKAPVYLADERTGQMMAIKSDTQIPVPKGGYDNPERNEDGTIVWEEKTFDKFKEEALEKGEDPGRYFYDSFMRKELDSHEGEEKRFAGNALEAEEQYENVRRVAESVKEQAKINPEQAKYSAIKYAEQFGTAPKPGSNEYGDFLEEPIKYLDKSVGRVKDQVDYYQELSRSYGARAFETQKKIEHIKPIEEVGLQRSAENIARLGIYAYDKEKKMDLPKPLYVAPENVFPEGGYSAHPSELRNLIVKSRDRMTDKLVKDRNMSEGEAKNIAGDHIKATFDIGHANTWRKYFDGDEKQFNKWLMEEVDGLVKDGIIGHVHISDNFGYYDEHVTPGEGNAPIQEFMEKLKESGHDEPVIVEPAHQDYRAWTGFMRNMGSPVYRVEGGSWTDIEGGYFGQTRAPSYVVGSYAPDYGAQEDQRDWILWSRIPLE